MIAPSSTLAIELGGLDIFLFIMALALSVVIGVYFANKNSTIDEYMLGGRDQRLWPVAMSMMTSFMSGLTLIGNPAELYYHGPSYALTAFSMIAAAPFATLILLPVFHRLGNLSVFQYLEQRYSRTMQKTASIVFMTEMILYNALVLYVPSLSLHSVLGISEGISIGAVGLSCIVYSTLGGIKAVIWTDFFQGGLMYLSLLCICIGGTLEVGSFWDMLDANFKGSRLSLDTFMQVDMTTRHTIFLVSTGSVISYIFMNGANQVQVQRALSLPTLRQGQWAQLITCFLTALVSLLGSYIGLILYATYQHCDPYESGQIAKRDAIVLHYIGSHLSFLPGLRGVFVAGIFAATLSTLSSFQNSMSALVIEDFIRPSLRKPLSEKWSIYLSKLLALLFGLACIGMTFVIGRVSGLLQVATTLHGAIGSPFLASFLLGMMTRFTNTLGISAGLIASLGLGIYIQLYQTFFLPPLEPSLPLSVDGCGSSFNLANLTQLTSNYAHHNDRMSCANDPDDFRLEKISYLWLPLIEFLVCIAVSTLVSLLSGGWRQQVDDRYLVSWLHTAKKENADERQSVRNYRVQKEELLDQVRNHVSNLSLSEKEFTGKFARVAAMEESSHWRIK